MFHPRRPFESEKLQLQELNHRLGQYLSRAKQLEQENAYLITEINKIRQDKSLQWENRNLAELREMRRMVEQLSFEKCNAEMEREKLRREIQIIQAMRSDVSKVNQGIDGELKGCERQLNQACQSNSALEQRLIELENEYKFLEDAHRQEITHFRSQVHSRVVPIATQTYHELPAVTMEEIQEYAQNLSESWMETFEIYRQRVEEIEESIKADQARLEDINREKMEYATELNKLRAEIEKQSKIQLTLEDQLIHMQENFRGEIDQYQMIIEELEHERSLLANTISERLKDHQELLQVKMGLGLEVAAYRALLEEEGRHAQMRADQRSRERIIDIKMPSQPYTPKVSSLSSVWPDLKSHFTLTTGRSARYMEPVSSIRTSAVSSQSDSRGTRIVPIKMTNQAQKSREARRDMISFTKASQEASAKVSKVGVSSTEKKKEVVGERSVEIKQGSQDTKDSLYRGQSRKEERFSPTATSTTEHKSVKVVSPPMMSLDNGVIKEGEVKVSDKRDYWMDGKKESDRTKTTLKQEETQNIRKEESKYEVQMDSKESGNVQPKVFTGEKKVLDSVAVEEIIEKVMKPAGLDSKLSASSDPKITYHVEKTEQEDGTTKTQIVLQSKVEEELDLSEDSALDELLSKGVKKVTLEGIKGTPTGNVIENLLSLGLKAGESLENKLVNVEIIEEPVESQSEEEIEVEAKSKPTFSQPSSMFFQIEELESDPQTIKHHGSSSEAMTASMTARGSVQVQECSRDTDSPYYSQGQESQEYFVSTPEENLSEAEEGGGFVSCGRYGVVDDLSDERYYQEEGLLMKKGHDDESDSYRESPDYIQTDHSFSRESFPECIIEEEVRVSPTVQQTVLDLLKEESLDPKQQLKGALEQLQGTVSGVLKEELSFFTKGSEDSDNLAVDIKKVEETSENGKTTIVAELSVSQTLEDSGLLQDQRDDLSEDQILAALRTKPGLHEALSGGAGGSYSVRVTKEEIQTEGMPSVSGREESTAWSTTEHIKLGPTEKTFTFQMDANSGSMGTASGVSPDVQGISIQEQRSAGASVKDLDEFGQVFHSHQFDPPLKVSHEKRVATVYLESTKNE
ncbi:synemin [Chanos chanos]|uniref:Synemin n=1 Tax=Chanos chanos TaxID=29144 RepID=A0A6J2UTU6_CHACN|nr:synemin [Chanos chanos]